MVALLQPVQKAVEMKVTEEQDVSGIEVYGLKEVPEQLWEMYEKAYQHLDWSQSQKVKELIPTYQDTFALQEG